MTKFPSPNENGCPLTHKTGNLYLLYMIDSWYRHKIHKSGQIKKTIKIYYFLWQIIFGKYGNIQIKWLLKLSQFFDLWFNKLYLILAFWIWKRNIKLWIYYDDLIMGLARGGNELCFDGTLVSPLSSSLANVNQMTSKLRQSTQKSSIKNEFPPL